MRRKEIQQLPRNLKEKIEILIIAKLSAEKGSTDSTTLFKKTKSRAEKAKSDNCQAFITRHSARFFLCVVCCGESKPAIDQVSDVKQAG